MARRYENDEYTTTTDEEYEREEGKKSSMLLIFGLLAALLVVIVTTIIIVCVCCGSSSSDFKIKRDDQGCKVMPCSVHLMMELKPGTDVYRKYVELQHIAFGNPGSPPKIFKSNGVGPHVSLLDLQLKSQDAYNKLRSMKDADLLSWIQDANLLDKNIEAKFQNALEMPGGIPAVEYHTPKGTDVEKLRVKVYSAAGADGKPKLNGAINVFHDKKGREVLSAWASAFRYHISFAGKGASHIPKAITKAMSMSSALNVKSKDFQNQIVFQFGA